MFIKRFHFSLLAFLFAASTQAQTISPGVLSSASGSAAVGNAQLDWVLGQSFANTATGNNAILTQGFVQPELQIWTGPVKMPAWGTCQLSIPYTVSGVVDPNNQFVAELSDANGSFANPIVVGTATGNTNGVINGVVPESVVSGNGYRIRVRSSLPDFIGIANEQDLVIRKPSIADAWAYGTGVQPNTLYPGWAPASSLTLRVKPNGAVNPVYTWFDDKGRQLGTGTHITVTHPGTYTVTVQANGCLSSATKTVKGVDVVCGTARAPRVLICQKVNGRYQTTCMLPSAVAFYLQTGALLAPCAPVPSPNVSVPTTTEPDTPTEFVGRFALTAYPNPSTDYFNVQVQSDNARTKITLRVLDLNGNPIEVFTNLSAQQVVRFGGTYATGVYVVEMVQGKVRTSHKLVKF